MIARIFFLILLVEVAGAEPPHFLFPSDPSVLDAQRDFGAKGDGKTDDTDALQAAIDASCGRDSARRGGKTNALFLPNGTYRVTRTLVVKSALGPWLSGESRDGVVIKLDDGVKDVRSVLRTHPNEKGPTSADWFMRNLRNFTIDVGDNPDTDGIRFYATNTGILKNVRVLGRGKVGVNAGFLDQSGPNLLQDVEISGFERGVQAQWVWGTTLSRVTIRDCRAEGLYVSANVVAAEDLVVEKTPHPVVVDLPNDWHHWSGVLALVGGRFSIEKGDVAVVNRGVLYARDLHTRGFGRAVEGAGAGGFAAGPDVEEVTSGDIRKLFSDAPDSALRLPIKAEPEVAWEQDPKRWLCADDFGVKTGDNEDDSEAIQRAMDAAAAQGKTVVYFRGCGGAEPNWIVLAKPVRVPAPVRMVVGLGWARLVRQGDGAFVVDDASAPVVRFQNLDSFGGAPIELRNTSASHTLVAESCGVRVVGAGAGDLFVTDVSGGIELQHAGQKCWARQLNPEGASDAGLVQNNGGDLWCLGVKHEGRGVRLATRAGGRTEVLGLFNYGGYPDEKDERPLFEIADGSFTVAGLREIAFGSHTATNKVREQRGAETKFLTKKTEGGWIGWSLFSGWKK